MNWYEIVGMIYIVIGLIITTIMAIIEKRNHYLFSHIALILLWPYWLLFDYRYYIRRKRRIRKEGHNA